MLQDSTARSELKEFEVEVQLALFPQLGSETANLSAGPSHETPSEALAATLSLATQHCQQQEQQQEQQQQQKQENNKQKILGKLDGTEVKEEDMDGEGAFVAMAATRWSVNREPDE